MVPLSEVISVKASAVLDVKLIGMITAKGFSRIPVFDNDFNDPVGILYLPDLITAAFEFDDDAPPVTVRSGWYLLFLRRLFLSSFPSLGFTLFVD